MCAAVLAGVMTLVSCNSPTAMKLSTAPTKEQKHYKGFHEIPKGASLIGESFTLEVTDEQGNVVVVRVSVHRPKAGRVEITVDNATYAIDNGNMEDLIDITRHQKGIALKGRGEILPRVKIIAEAVVETGELQKAVGQLRSSKAASPMLQVEAELPNGRQTLNFSVEPVNK